MADPSPRSLRFVDSMPRPLIVAFLAFAAAGIGLVVWLFANPPSVDQVALELRRSAPAGSLTHDVVRHLPVDVPTPLPAFEAPCASVRGLVVEGGMPALDRIERVLDPVCDHIEGERSPSFSDDVLQAIRALSSAKIRFALFTRTGELSTADLGQRRIFLAVALSSVEAPAGPIAPLLIHEGYHLSIGAPVSAAQEFRARRAEYEACRVLFERKVFTRGCDDAEAMVRLGEARAVELLVRAGYPE